MATLFGAQRSSAAFSDGISSVSGESRAVNRTLFCPLLRPLRPTKSLFSLLLANPWPATQRTIRRATLVEEQANNKSSVDKQKRANSLAKRPNVCESCVGVFKHRTGLQSPKPVFVQIGQKQFHWSLPSCKMYVAGRGPLSTTIICSVEQSHSVGTSNQDKPELNPMLMTLSHNHINVYFPLKMVNRVRRNNKNQKLFVMFRLYVWARKTVIGKLCWLFQVSCAVKSFSSSTPVMIRTIAGCLNTPIGKMKWKYKMGRESREEYNPRYTYVKPDFLSRTRKFRSWMLSGTMSSAAVAQ